MRIAFVSQPRDTFALPPDARSGSVAVVTGQLALRLAARGHEVAVVAPRGAGELEEERVGGVRILRVSAPGALRFRLGELAAGIVGGLAPPPLGRGFFESYYRAVAVALRRLDPEIVQIQTFAQAAPRLRAACPAAVLLLHAHDPQLAFLEEGERKARLTATDGVVTVSDWLTRRLTPLCGPIEVTTIGNGAPGAWLQAAPADPAGSHKLLFVGRLSPEKGLHLLLPAFERALAAAPRAELHLVGRPGLFPAWYLRRLETEPPIAALRPFYGKGLPGRARNQLLGAGRRYLETCLSMIGAPARARVHVHGSRPHATLETHYREAAALVAPSAIAEPFAVPVAEAMALGLPVVAADDGAPAGMVGHGTGGLLARRGDAGALAEALATLLADPALRRRMGRAARLRAEQLTWEEAAARLEKAMEAARCRRTSA